MIAGILAVALVALWLRSAGAPLAGVIAAFLLAVNPWHLRWSTTVGGYSESLSWLLLAMVVAAVALETGRWRWFLIGSLLQALALLSCTSATAAVVTVLIYIAVTLIVRRDGISFGRWLVATCIGAMLVIQILAPVVTASIVGTNELQPMVAGASVSEQMGEDRSWVDLWSQAVAGSPWSTGASETGDGATDSDSSTVSVEDMGPAGSWIFGLALPLLALAGLVGGVVRERIKMILLYSVVGSGLFAAAVLWSGGQLGQATSEWYALFLCIVICLCLACLVEWLRRSDSPIDRNRLNAKGEGKVAWVVAVVLVVLYVLVTWAPRSALLGSG